MSRPPLHVRIAHWFGESLNRVGEAWHNLVEPIEDFFGHLGERLFGVFDSFEALESAVVRFVGLLLWPFAAVGRLVGRWLPNSGEPDSGLMSLPGRVLGYLGSRTLWLAEKFNLDGLLFFVIWLLTPLWFPIASLLGFIFAWLNTRRPRELALGLPAVLLAAPFAYVAIASATSSQGEIAENYKLAVRESLEAGDYECVALFERKLAQLGIDTRRSEYRNALTLEKDGDLATAYERMWRIASPVEPGYAAAHAWIAERLIDGTITIEQEPRLEEDSARLELAEQHLDQLRTLSIDGPGIAQMRAYIYAQTGRIKEAADVLQPFTEEHSAAAAMRLRLLVQNKQDAEAQGLAKRMLADIERQGPSNKPQTVADHQTHALAAQLVGNEAQLELALERWQATDKEDSHPSVQLSALRRRQFERLLGTATAAPARVAAALVEASRLQCPPSWIRKQVHTIARQRDESHSARLMWEQLVNESKASAELMQVVGTVAAGEGQIVVGRNIFQRITEADPDSPVAWNNYAWTLSQPPEADLPSALQAVDRALKLKPNDFRFRETRGQLHVKLQNWLAAVEDLEFALNGMPDSAEIHQSLAKAYDALSKPQLAELHRQQADL